jgi:hypothetical protein
VRPELHVPPKFGLGPGRQINQRDIRDAMAPICHDTADTARKTMNQIALRPRARPAKGADAPQDIAKSTLTHVVEPRWSAPIDAGFPRAAPVPGRSSPGRRQAEVKINDASVRWTGGKPNIPNFSSRSHQAKPVRAIRNAPPIKRRQHSGEWPLCGLI